jgi:hypothetical protein
VSGSDRAPQVRKKGSQLEFSNCTNVYDHTCLNVADYPANATWDCKDIDNYECGELDQLFKVSR